MATYYTLPLTSEVTGSNDYRLGSPTESVSGLIRGLDDYWIAQGAEILQPWDTEMGAGTFHPATFFGALTPKPCRFAYVQPCRRPTDGRYGNNPNRLQRYYQYQVILKPAPANIQALYLDSLDSIGLDRSRHDVRFIEDNWESPTLGALGYGWEIWVNGMEVTQFTYFQRIGGKPLSEISVELTYGIERIAMYLQDRDSVYDLKWAANSAQGSKYKNWAHRIEQEFSAYNLEYADTVEVERAFAGYEKQASDQLLRTDAPLPYASYDAVLHCSHLFNLLDARQAISPSARQDYIHRIYSMASAVAEAYTATDSDSS